MDLDPLQSTFLGSQLFMSAFSLFLFATYRLRFLAYFSAVSLTPLANITLQNQFLIAHWPLSSASLEGFRLAVLCVAHAAGLQYAVQLSRVTGDGDSFEKVVSYLAHTCWACAIIPLLGFIELSGALTTGLFGVVYVAALGLWFRTFRFHRTMSLYMTAGVVLITIAFIIDYSADYQLSSLSSTMTALYSMSVIGSFFLFCVANIVGINLQLQAREAERIDVEQRSKMATLGEIASSIAHEIKNPLAAITYANELQINLLNKETINKPALLKLNSNISKTTSQIKSIIDSLQSLSRNAAQDPFDVTDVKSIIERTLTLFNIRLRKTDTEFRVSRLRENWQIKCRDTQVCQVLLNLLNNAFDAVQQLPTKWVRLDIEERDQYIVFSVIDSGHGIPDEERQNILRSFYTTKAKGQGTGLGLNICKRIIDAHEGKLIIKEQDGHTCFEVLLPRVPS